MEKTALYSDEVCELRFVRWRWVDLECLQVRYLGGDLSILWAEGKRQSMRPSIIRHVALVSVPSRRINQRARSARMQNRRDGSLGPS